MNKMSLGGGSGSDYSSHKKNFFKEILNKDNGNFDIPGGDNHEEIGRGSTGGGTPAPTPRQLVQPATQADLEALTGQYEGKIENWRERFPEDRIEHYRDGASGGVFKAWDTKTGRVVGLKELKGSKKGVDLEFLQTGEEQIRNIGDMISALGKSQHPGLMRIYGYYETERRGLKYPQLVFELIDQPSMLDIINGGASEEDVRKFLISGGSTLHDLHTRNGQPIFHRDVKPANFMAMPEDGRWPYVLVDLGTVGIGVRETLKGGTHAGTVKYVPHKQLAFGKMNKWGENFALIRSAIHYALGSRFDEIDLDDFDIRSLELNYSEKLLKVFATATTQDESKGYSNFKKLMHDLGYGNSRVPQTRQELEAILGHKSLPARIEPEKREFDKDGMLPYIVRVNQDGTVGIGYRGYTNPDEVGNGWTFIGKNVYEVFRDINTQLTTLDTDKATLTYLAHLAQENPIFQEVLDGKVTHDEAHNPKMESLEDVLKEKKPSHPLHLFDRVMNNLFIDNPRYSEDIRVVYKQEKETYNSRRKQLYEIFGFDEKNFKLKTKGAIYSSLCSFPFSAGLVYLTHPGGFWPFFAGLSFGSAGIITGSKIKKYFVKRKLRKQAREVDSWIAEAQRIQNPSPLEIKAGEAGDVKLTKEEERKIEAKASIYTGSSGFLMAAGGMGLSALFGASPEIACFFVGGSVPLLIGNLGKNAFKDYLKKRKLKQKRLATGLDEDGMRNYSSLIGIEDFRVDTSNEILSELGFKKKRKFLRNILDRAQSSLENYDFVGKNVKVMYTLHFQDEGLDHGDLVIAAKPGAEEEAERITDALQGLASKRINLGNREKKILGRAGDSVLYNPHSPLSENIDLEGNE